MDLGAVGSVIAVVVAASEVEVVEAAEVVAVATSVEEVVVAAVLPEVPRTVAVSETSLEPRSLSRLCSSLRIILACSDNLKSRMWRHRGCSLCMRSWLYVRT